jgi:hypothetical protein
MIELLISTLIIVLFAIILVPIYVCWQLDKKLNWKHIKFFYKEWLLK